MIPKNILKDYPAEDWETMQNAQKSLQVFYYENNKKASKRELKKTDPETFYSWLYRATFHYSAVREINGQKYYFKNNYCFTN